MRRAIRAVLITMAAGSMTICGSAQENTAGMNTDMVASSDEMAQSVQVVTEDMKPVYADSLKEGTYPIEVLCSSSMFAIHDCQITVEDGELSAALTMDSDSYLKLFLGTGLEAVAAQEEEYITFEENEEGLQVYVFPVEALDMGIDCAAWSRRKEKWYDRTLVFSTSSLPTAAFLDSFILTMDEMELEDGSYTVEATLEGGSGRTTVESPVIMTVEDGKAEAVITISSPSYDYVLVDGEKYTRTNEEGNSTFEIPVSGFDWRMPFVANSTAMGTSHEIDYTLLFDSETIEKAE